jgi:hypothetical protein
MNDEVLLPKTGFDAHVLHFGKVTLGLPQNPFHGHSRVHRLELIPADQASVRIYCQRQQIVHSHSFGVQGSQPRPFA